MDEDELERMVGDPRFISGIYNFCDRWCERCPFTSRCLNYAMGEKLEKEVERRRSEGENEAFWERMDAKAEDAADSVAALADGDGDPDDPWDAEIDEQEFQEYQREQEERREKARRHPAAMAAHRYMGMVDAWFSVHAPLVEEKLKLLNAEPPPEPDAADPGEEAAFLDDAVEVIRWYQHQIWVKLMRALHRDPWEDEEWEADDDEDDDDATVYPKDSDVSAKIILIGMDRSLAAWGDVRRILPSAADSATKLLVHLVRLRRLVEQTFPDARGVVRPAFDTPAPPLEGS